MKTLILVVAMAAQITAATRTVVPPISVQERVKPVLDLCESAEAKQGEAQSADFYQAAKVLGQLFQLKTKSSDEALVVLMGFYIGESTEEDLLHEVTARGKRMLPFLLKYRKASVTFSQREYTTSLFLSPDVRRRNFDEAIRSVRAGKVLGEE